MKKIVYAFFVLTILIAIFFYYKKNKQPLVNYNEFQIKKGSLTLSILATGTVQPKNRLEIKAPVAGRIEQVLIKEGSLVAKGQILAWMSSTERAAMLDAARAKGDDEYKKWSELYLPTPVMAPIKGTIILKSVEPGQTFTNADAIFTMSDHLTVKALVDETDIAQIKLQSKANIILDAYPKENIEGHVDQLAFDATTTNNVTTYAIDVKPVFTPSYMRSGMTANITFYVEEKNAILLIPNEAFKVVEGKSFVLKKNKPNPIQVTIKTGVSDGKFTEILEGLKENDIVLIQNYSIDDGTNKTNNPFAPKFPKGKKNSK